MHYIAAQLGMLVDDLEPRLTAKAYYNWLDYFNQLNGNSEKPNALDSDDDLLREFELGN